jgi:hypothetical protein
MLSEDFEGDTLSPPKGEAAQGEQPPDPLFRIRIVPRILCVTIAMRCVIPVGTCEYAQKSVKEKTENFSRAKKSTAGGRGDGIDVNRINFSYFGNFGDD